MKPMRPVAHIRFLLAMQRLGLLRSPKLSKLRWGGKDYLGWRFGENFTWDFTL